MPLCKIEGCLRSPKHIGLCKTCYHREYDRTEKRKAYKKKYNSLPERKAYSKKYSKTQAFKENAKRFQKTDKFHKIQERYRMTNKAKFNLGVREAKERKLVWTITYDEYINLVQSNTCHYCYESLSPYGMNLDRKENSIDYILTNVVPCCGECNRTKGDRLSYEEMVAISKLLREMRKK